MKNMTPNQKWNAANVQHVKAYQAAYYRQTKWRRIGKMNERARERYHMLKELQAQRMCLLN
jgi:hypothetical protein